MAERSKAVVLKTTNGQLFVSSNLTSSAITMIVIQNSKERAFTPYASIAYGEFFIFEGDLYIKTRCPREGHPLAIRLHDGAWHGLKGDDKVNTHIDVRVTVNHK